MTSSDDLIDTNPAEKTSQIYGDSIAVGSIEKSGAVAIGRGARAINQYTEIIVTAENFEDLPPADGKPPYKGLTYFTENDKDNYFGLEKLSDKLVKRLQKSRFLALIGASGSGKSSLLRAGIIPRLRASNWVIHIVSPGVHPLSSLAASLTQEELDPASADNIAAAMVKSPDTLGKVGDKLAARKDADRLLLAIDQFEELFTQCKDPAEQQAFVDNLVAAAQAGGATTILLSMRADFYDRLSEFAILTDLVSQQQDYITPMAQEDLVRVIAEPARLGGWQLVKGLVEQILKDVGNEPGRLPLLSHALLETWKNRSGTTMTLNGYLATGGIEKAIAKTADDTMACLSDSQIAIARNIFLSLTEISGGELYTRRIVSYRELEEKEDNKQQLYLTLEELVDSRLITIDSDQIEVAHEALLRRWPRLHKWLEDSREQLLIERKLQRDAADWVMKDRDSSLLYRGSRLKEVLYWSNKTASKLGFNEKEFLQRSKKHQRRKFFVSGSIRIAAFLMLLVVFAIFIREIRQAKSRWQALNNSPESTIYSMTLVDLSNNKTLVDLNKPQLCVGTGSQGVLCNEGSDDGQYIYNDGGWWSIFENGIEADKPSWMDIIVGRAILNAGISDRSRAIVYIVADSANSGDIYALDINLNPLILKLGKSFKWQELTTDPKTFCTGRRYLKDYKFDVHSATVLVACYDSEDGQSYLRVGLVDENDIENSTWKTFTYPDSLPGREVSAAYIGRKDGQIYLGTEKGLYRGEATSPNSWGAPLLNLPYIQLIEPDPLSTDSLFLATYDEITEKGTVLQWEVGALNPPSIIEEYSNRPISMTAIPDLVQGWQLFILLENGDVLDIAPNRRSEIIPYHPANSIGKAFSILAVRPSSTEQPQLFLGHVDGLFELK